MRGDRPWDFTGHKWGYDNDTGIASYSIEVPCHDLPDGQAALATLKAGRAVDLPFSIYVELDDESGLVPGAMYSELKIAPTGIGAVLYRRGGCQVGDG